MTRTMRDIGVRYDERREKILAHIRSGECSASMSGIEYYPKSWAELDLNDESDADVISTALTWNVVEGRHDREGLRKFTPDELAVRKELMDLYFQPVSEERESKRRQLIKLLDELRRIALGIEVG